MHGVRQRFDYRDYLLLEESSPIKHEYLDGQVWAMAGGTPEHAAIAANVIIALGTRLVRQPCQVYSSDLRIRVEPTGLATYPDVSVICGRLETDPDDPKGHTAINPTLIVEVLSPSTEEYDRGEKLSHYKGIASLREIVLIAHEEHRIERWRREGDRWTLDVVRGEGAVRLDCIGCELDLSEVYRDSLS